MKGIWHLL